MNRAALSACLLVSGLVAALAGCATECAPTLQEGWIRAGPPGMTMRAGFGRIVNDCPTALEITGASSPAFDDVSLHRTTIVEGVSRMRAVPVLQVPANGERVLEPGGLHLMLSGGRGGFASGDRVPVAFEVGTGGSLRGTLEVR